MSLSIVFSTSHPAPYWDVVYKQVSEKFDVVVYYNRRKDVSKAWKRQNNFEGKIESEVGLIEKWKDMKSCDFALLGGWNYSNNLLFAFLLILQNKPFAFFSDVPDEESISFIKKLLKKIFFSFVPYLFVTGESCKKHYKKHYGIDECKIVTFPYGVIFPSKEKVAQKLKEKELSENEGVLKIFTANRFLERKGYETFYKALEVLKENGSLMNYQITIAGHGELFDFYKAKFISLDPNIRLVGWIELDEYEKHLDTSDIYIHASYFEPYGIPVIDAMARGKIVVASDGVMSAVDMIESGNNGFIYSKYDSDELAKILISLANENEQVSLIKKNALHIHESYLVNYNFTIQTYMKSWS